MTRDCPAAIAGASISGWRAAGELDAVTALHGKLYLVVTDHRTAFTGGDALGALGPRLG